MRSSSCAAGASAGRDRGRRRAALVDGRRPGAAGQLRRRRARRRLRAARCSSRGPTACATGATPSTASSTASRSRSPSAATPCTASCCRAGGGACAPRRAACRSSYALAPRAGYPFALALVAVDYELTSGGVVTTLHATNVGTERAPFGAGLHPYLTPGTPDVDDWCSRSRRARRVPVDERLLPAGAALAGRRDRARLPRRAGPWAALRLDTCFGDLGRSPAGVARVRRSPAREASGSSRSGWTSSFRFVQVFTADDVPDRATSPGGPSSR